jgi:hypothetical protein
MSVCFYFWAQYVIYGLVEILWLREFDYHDLEYELGFSLWIGSASVDLNAFYRAILLCTGFEGFLFPFFQRIGSCQLINYRCTLLCIRIALKAQIYLIEYIFTDANFYIAFVLLIHSQFFTEDDFIKK